MCMHMHMHMYTCACLEAYLPCCRQAITMLIPLSAGDAYSGGGTAFWSGSHLRPNGCERPSEHPSEQPTTLSAP